MKKNYTRLDWLLSQQGAGAAGSFYKAIEDETYYKASMLLPDKLFGYEAVNEVLAARVGRLLDF